MKRIKEIVVLSTVSAVLSTGALFAQNRDDHHDDHRDAYADHRDNRHDNRRDWNDRDHDHYIRHEDWRRGHRLPPDYWEHAHRVNDWRAYHLRRPPRGYEWREVDGNYVLAAAATGLIASVIAANAAH